MSQGGVKRASTGGANSEAGGRSILRSEGPGVLHRHAPQVWVRDPHSGGAKIPPTVRKRTQQRILKDAEARYAAKFTRLDIRFRGALCYVDVYTEPAVPSRGLLRALGETRQQYLQRMRNVPLHLCRLRYFGDEEAWSMAFYTYSNERYEPCTFRNGTFYGTPEGAFEVGAAYLHAR